MVQFFIVRRIFLFSDISQFPTVINFIGIPVKRRQKIIVAISYVIMINIINRFSFFIYLVRSLIIFGKSMTAHDRIQRLIEHRSIEASNRIFPFGIRIY